MQHTRPHHLWLVYALGVMAWITSASSYAAATKYSVTTQYAALAPNAGGQVAYAARLSTNNWEWGAFSNQYLLAGDLPLSGLTLGYRLDLCEKNCWWNYYVITGVGGSNGGPLAEISWGTTMPIIPLWLPRGAWRYYPAIRIDFTSQMIMTRTRAITWSLPLWVGLSVPF